MEKARYKRVFLKLSGEALALKNEDGTIREIFDAQVIDSIADNIRECTELGVQIGIMIGAGNIWRGRMGKGVDRAKADHMGMLATTINCLRFQDALIKKGCGAVVMTTVTMDGFTEVFSPDRAKEYLASGRPVIFAIAVRMTRLGLAPPEDAPHHMNKQEQQHPSRASEYDRR